MLEQYINDKKIKLKHQTIRETSFVHFVALFVLLFFAAAAAMNIFRHQSLVICICLMCTLMSCFFLSFISTWSNIQIESSSTMYWKNVQSTHIWLWLNHEIFTHTRYIADDTRKAWLIHFLFSSLQRRIVSKGKWNERQKLSHN